MENENELRVLVFGAALIARTIRYASNAQDSTRVDAQAITEAQAVADAVIEEAKRLRVNIG